ncbi:MAG: glycosyltransferase family 4 protein, partial [Actinomycetota bacterium]
DPDRPVVGAVGTGDWRKGIDLFVQTAARVVARSGRPPMFVWVGPLVDEDRVRHDIEAAGLGGHVLLVGPVPDAGAWYPAFDVLVSTAREDPFPLVGLEGGGAGRPIVAFASGGLRELLAHGRGIVVDALDVAGLADAVLDLLADPGRASELGGRLARHVQARHTPDSAAGPMWDALIGAAR